MAEWVGAVAGLVGASQADRRQRNAFNRMKELQDEGLGYVRPIGEEGKRLFSMYAKPYADQQAKYADELLNQDPYSSTEDQYLLDQAHGDINAMYSGAQRDMAAGSVGRGIGDGGGVNTVIEQARLEDEARARRALVMDRIRQKRANREHGIAVLGDLTGQGTGYMGETANYLSGAASQAAGVGQQEYNAAGADLASIGQMASLIGFYKKRGGGAKTPSTPMTDEPNPAWSDQYGLTGGDYFAGSEYAGRPSLFMPQKLRLSRGY